MVLQNYMLIGLQKIIERRIIFLRVTEFYLIMKVQEEAKPLLQKKLFLLYAGLLLKTKNYI